MAKSVYSLVLSDEIIEAIDGFAARLGHSRSGLVNHILAEYASLSTPEARMREVAMAIQQAVDEALPSSLSAGGTLTLTSALRYKYNPSLRYVVELYDGQDSLGELRVGLRSQNETLLVYVTSFFAVWQRLEEAHLPHPPGEASRPEGSRYRRLLRTPPGSLTKRELGEAIGGYVSRMDACVKAFFGSIHDAGAAVQAAETAYLQALGNGPAALL